MAGDFGMTSASPFAADYSSGLLLHVRSLPSSYGIGDLGLPAFRWIDRLQWTDSWYSGSYSITPRLSPLEKWLGVVGGTILHMEACRLFGTTCYQAERLTCSVSDFSVVAP